jgi:hypothetical protein
VKAVVPVLLLLVVAAPAAAQEPLRLEPYRDGTGYLGMRVTGPPGTTATVYETTGGTPVALGRLAVPGELRRAVRWTCTGRHRMFRAVTAEGLTADATRTTPRCRSRFSLHVRPSRPRAGRPLTILLVDRWRIGGTESRVCARGPEGRGRCRKLKLAEHRMRAAWRIRPGAAGRWSVRVRTPGAPARRVATFVRPRSGRLSLLATGDSMIQIIDGFLDARLSRSGVAVHTDARISTGITKPFLLNWPLHARGQARRLRPDVSVVFLGANDGYPLRSRSGRRVDCCGRGWVAAYARKASAMMSSYARHGGGTVYWATLPAPRKASYRAIYRRINAALRDAARRHPGEVHIVPLARRFTPGYRFRQTIRWGGRTVSVRQGDGIHLNITGASIAATMIVKAMRRDGVI